MSETLYLYTLDEVLAKGDSSGTFKSCLSGTANLTGLATHIIAMHGDWIGMATSETDEAKVKASAITMVSRWTSWLKLKAVYWDDYISRQAALSGKTEGVTKFVDTPETETDYSGETHTTNVTRTESSSDNIAGIDRLAPFVETLVRDFRKTWLMPKEAL